jgi:outer membrane protein assembly factor BamB
LPLKENAGSMRLERAVNSHPSNFSPDAGPKPRPRLRWWPALVILAASGLVILGLRTLGEATFQERNIRTGIAGFATVALLALWWLAFSRSAWRWRLGILGALILLVGAGIASFRIRGVSGDLVPILELRWARALPPVEPAITNAAAPVSTNRARPDFPQFLGPRRSAVLDGPALDTDWAAHPPEVLWRQQIGAAWSGFAIVGGRAVTQEQRGEEEQVSCYDLFTGRRLWSHGDAAHYHTTIAGEGPRCTPTVAGGRVFTLGATGILNCLDLESGRLFWSHRITEDAGVNAPQWGFSGSPLVLEDRVLVSGGGKPDKSILAYRVSDGQRLWTAGSSSVSYSSLSVVTLAGVRQILAFNARRITGHDARDGTVLWNYPWGVGQPQVAVPVVVGTNRVLFSSGYGVGSQLLEIIRTPNGQFEVHSLWKSIRMKAKLANLVARNGFLYGLDDGILACLDLRDGSQRWKEGRYGHGQGLLIDDLYLLMAEDGELILLHPTPEGPGELRRFRVFDVKTWNPPALSGDLLLVRNDREAACLRLPLRER